MNFKERKEAEYNSQDKDNYCILLYSSYFKFASFFKFLLFHIRLWSSKIHDKFAATVDKDISLKLDDHNGGALDRLDYKSFKSAIALSNKMQRNKCISLRWLFP